MKCALLKKHVPQSQLEERTVQQLQEPFLVYKVFIHSFIHSFHFKFTFFLEIKLRLLVFFDSYCIMINNLCLKIQYNIILKETYPFPDDLRACS